MYCCECMSSDILILHCAVQGKIHSHPKDSNWKFLGGCWSKRANILEAKYEAKLEFLREGSVKQKLAICAGGRKGV